MLIPLTKLQTFGLIFYENKITNIDFMKNAFDTNLDLRTVYISGFSNSIPTY